MNINPKTKKYIRGCKIFVNLVIWILLVLASLLLFFTVVSNKTDVFGHRMFVIMSGSMEPTIMTKDAIVTKQIDEPKEGDVVAFKSGNVVTVHRIIKVEETNKGKKYQTQGDNNDAPDRNYIEKDQIVGKVQLVIPKLGGVILFLQHNLIFVVFVIVILIVFEIIRRMILSGKEDEQ